MSHGLRWRGGIMAVVLGCWGVLLTGCQTTAPLPTYPWQGADAVVETVRARAQGITTLTAEFSLTVRPPKQRDRVTLDGVWALRQGGYCRLQAWKFDQDIFDLTLTPAGTWLWMAQRPGGSGTGNAHDAAPMIPQLPTSGGGGAWFSFLLGQPAGDTAYEVIAAQPAGSCVVQYALPQTQGWTVQWVMDAPTRTVRQCRVRNDQGQVVETITLDDYRAIGEVVFPYRIQASGAWELTLRLQDVTLNPDLPPEAFTPRPDAVLQSSAASTAPAPGDVTHEPAHP